MGNARQEPPLNLAINPSGEFGSMPGSIPVGAIVVSGTAWGAPARLPFIFCLSNRVSSCWYFCWYRQRWAKKLTLYSDGYGISWLSARGKRGTEA